MAGHRVLLTGPIEGIERYADAAREAGWTPLEEPLLQLTRKALPKKALEPSPDWICVTSSNAIAALAPHKDRLHDVPVACVGSRTAGLLADAGLAVRLGPAVDAEDLAGRVLGLAKQHGRVEPRVLWPRGSLSVELGERLRAGGVHVDDPVVYTIAPRRAVRRVGDAEAIFFASPSAVRRYAELAGATDDGGRVAVAIGATTAGAVPAGRFRSEVVLTAPRPAALAAALASLG